MGKVTTNHILAINEETFSGADSVIDFATEVKAVVLLIHTCPEGSTSIKHLYICPQSTNEVPIHSMITFMMF